MLVGTFHCGTDPKGITIPFHYFTLCPSHAEKNLHLTVPRLALKTFETEFYIPLTTLNYIILDVN